MSECAFISTPMSAKSFKATQAVFNTKEMPYSKLIGKLLNVSNSTRPDITISVNHLSRYMSHPDVEHWLPTKRFFVI